jgi:succinoglycan biosynthesis protein ExoM
MKIAVCIITYQRPVGLARLLDGLNGLTFAGDSPDISCVVVDNDETASVREVCDEIRPGFRWSLQYYVEPRRGIPFARNAAIAHAGTDYDYLAFIDDDEVPDANWLDELLRVMKEYEADVVAGPVVPHFEERPPAWVIKGRFYNRYRGPTGGRLNRAFTGNIMFRRDVLEEMGAHFDERLALTGGSDSHFLRRVHGAGHKIVWADEAVATEWVPATRVGARWILQRAYRYGTTMAFIQRDLHPVCRSTLTLLFEGSVRIARGSLLLPFGVLCGRHKIVASLRLLFVGAGIFAGLGGARYDEYRRIHGT